jgi:hypothetical protein
MITFGPMPPLASHMHLHATAAFRAARDLAGCVALAAAAASSAAAQTGISHDEDAAPVPARTLRLSAANVWTQYDSRFATNGIRPLGADLSTDSLGPRQLPNLEPTERALQALTGNPSTRLTLGRLDVRSDARIVSTNLALDYGVTRRFSVGVLVPIVQTRRTAQARVNVDTAAAVRANVGYVPVLGRADVARATLGTVNALTEASARITQLLGRCQQAPAAAECDPVRGREVSAAAAARSAADFASAVTAAYGTTLQTALIAPRTGSPLATLIDARRAALEAQLRTYVPSASVAALATASTEFAYADFQGRNGVAGLLQSRLGGGLDSIRTSERIGVGDVQLRARYLVIDRVTYDTGAVRGLQTRLAVTGALRFATSVADSTANLVDIGTGDGAGAEVRSALDIAGRRVGVTLAARYARSLARTVSVPVLGYASGEFPLPVFGEVSRTAGDVMAMDVTPRLFFGEWMAFEGQYGFERRGGTTYSGGAAAAPDPLCLACQGASPITSTPATAMQVIGVGLRYSTVDAYLRGRARYPVEVSYRHLEALTGDAGSPKTYREQIQLRIYYRLLRR